MLANKRTPRGMAMPIPILLEVGSPEKAAEGLGLGSELTVVYFGLKEDFAAASEVTDFVALGMFALSVFTATLKLEVVVVELSNKLAGGNVVNAIGVPIGLALSVSSTIRSTDVGVGLIDEELDVLAVAAGTLEGSSLPHVSQPSESLLATLH